jgi:hypothetical protein
MVHSPTTVGHLAMRHLGLRGDLFGVISSGLSVGCGVLGTGGGGLSCGSGMLGGIGGTLGALRRARRLLRRLLCSLDSVAACAARRKRCEHQRNPCKPDKSKSPYA